MANPFDQFDTPAAANPFDKFDAPAAKPAGALRKLGDLGLSAAKGVIAVPEAGIGLANLVTGGRAGKLAEDVGVRFKDAKDVLTGFQSDDLKAKQQAFSQADGVVDKFGVALSNPSLIANTVVESVPAMLVGGVAARGVLAAAPRLGAVGAGAVGEGLIGAGSAAEGIRQQTDDGLLSAKQTALAAGTGVATGAFGTLGGMTARRLGIGDFDTMIAQGGRSVAGAAGQAPKGIVRRAAEGAFAEGVLEELPQSLSEQALQNAALDKPLTEGLADAGVMGVLAGGVMGAGAGALSRQTPAPIVPPPVDPVVNTTTAPLGLPPPAITVGSDGLAMTTEQRQSMRDNSGATDIEARIPSKAMGIDPSAGPLSAAAAQAVDTGLTQQVTQQAALEQAAAIADKAPAATKNVASETAVTSQNRPDALNMRNVDPDTGEIRSAYDVRQADAPRKEPGDIMSATGQPFVSGFEAAKAAKQAGPGHRPFKLAAKQFVVRKTGADLDSTSNAVPDVPATASGSGSTESGISLETGLGTGATAGPAVDAGRVRDQSSGANVPLANTTDDAAVNGQNTPPAASTTQAQTPPVEAPKVGAPDPAGQTAAGAVPGAGAVQAAGVAAAKQNPADAKQRLSAEADEKPAGPQSGQIGAKYSQGDTPVTSSGRRTSPFPKVQTDTNRKAGNTVKAVDSWLMQNALDEANSRGDEFNARQFEARLKNPKTADKDSAEEYLFGESQPAVPRPFTRPLVPVVAAPGSVVAGAAPVSEPNKPAAKSQPAQTAINSVATPASVQPAPATTKNAKPKGLKQIAAQRIAQRADYFTPGNVVRSYGGYDEVVSYTPPNESGSGWSVKVRAVVRKDGQWVPDPKDNRERLHTSAPSTKELDQGPVVRAEPAAAQKTETKLLPAQQIRGQGAIKNVADNRVGKDNTPLSEGGKPFKNKLQADAARKLQPMMRVVRVDGGFALADKTPAQLAAQEASSRRLRNANTSPAGEPIPAHAFIAAEGGLHVDTRADMNIGGNPRFGNRTLFAGANRAGLSMERATERLIEEGYLPEGASQNQAMALIKRSINNPQYTPEGVERMAEQEAEQRRKDYDAEQDALALAQEAEDNAYDAAATAEDAATAEVQAFSDNEAQALDDASIPWDAPSNTSTEAAMRALGFTEQEIQDAIATEQGITQKTGLGGRSADESAATQTSPDLGGRESPPGAVQGQDTGLTAPSQQEVLDQQGRKSNAEALDQKEQIDREASGQSLTSQTAPEQRTDTSGDMFAMEKAVAEIDKRKAGKAAKADPNQGGMFDTPEVDPVAEAKATLDANNVTGKERLDVIKDVKAGALTAQEVKEAYPVKSESANQPKQTDTPAFKKWYGNWQDGANEKSSNPTADDGRRGQDVNAVQRREGMGKNNPESIKVGKVLFTGATGPLGEDGKPVVFYHGTKDDVAAFDLNHKNRKDKGWLGRGIYASTSVDLGQLYAEQKRGLNGELIMPLFMAVRNPYLATTALKARLKNASQAQIDSYTQQLKDAGHDGVVMAFSDGNVELMAFEPTQVKSAIGNNGNFDASNPDIRFSRATDDVGPEQNARQNLSQADVSDPQTGVSTALLYLGQDDSLYQLPRSSAKGMQAIAADKGVQFTIEAESVTQPDGTERPTGIFNLTMPSGAKASITVDGGEVYINVAGLKEGDGGNAVYDVAANYAVNNGLVFKGDPSGLSNAAMRRRLENMLSSAIEYGTTDHLRPHPRQLQGDASIGVPALKWTPGDTLGNIRTMVDASIEANDYSNPFGATLEYDPSSQRFKDPADGRNLEDQEVRAFSEIDERHAGAGTAGRTTLQRTALFKSLVQSEEARRAFLESIRRQQSGRGTGAGAAGSALGGAFYSRNADPVVASQSTQAVEKIVQRITSRWANAPEVIVVYDMTDPRIPVEARAKDLEQRSGGAKGEPEGFFFEGKAYILASQVSSQKDITRVLLHESLGHFGLRGVFGQGLTRVLNQVVLARRDDVIAKARQYGLGTTVAHVREQMVNERLKLQREQILQESAGKTGADLVKLVTAAKAAIDKDISEQAVIERMRSNLRQAAEEVLAELAQTRPELGIVKRAIAAIRTWLRENMPGFEKMALSDADIIANYILPARGFVERGAKAQMRSAVPAFARGGADQTDTPAFKTWFGDWNTAKNQSYLRSKTLAKVTGAEFGPGFDLEPVSMPSLRKTAENWATDNLVGEYTNKRSGLVLDVRKSGIEQAIQHGGAADKLRAFAAIGSVLRDGVVVFDGQNPKNARARLVVVSGKVAINGKDFYVAAGFREDANGRLFYDHELMGVERADQLSSQRGESLASNHPLLSARLNDYTVNYLSQEVQSSKIVDAEGKPLVVYHGTRSDIQAVEAGKSERLPGFWMTTDPKLANTYAAEGVVNASSYREGANVLPLFAKIKKPYRYNPKKKPMYMAWQEYQEGDYDGFIETGADAKGFTTLNVKSGDQVKSAIGNNGNFDASNPDIRFSRSKAIGDTLQASWNSPEPSKFDDLVYKLQDKQIDTKRVIESIRSTAGALADEKDVYLQEELFHGRAAARSEDFLNKELGPLINSMKLSGLDIETLDEYLHARHAEEANALIASRNAEIQDGGSGMTTQAARDYLAQLDPRQRAKLQAAAAKVDAILAGTRQLYADYDLESDATIKGWSDMFKHYVPLMREEKDGGMGVGQGFSIKGRETKSRTGSTRKVVDILANIAMQRERAIVRGEKNRVAVALVGLVKANPNKDFWQTGSPPSEKVYDAKTNKVVTRTDPMYKSRENVVVAKVRQADGSVVEQAVIFNEDNERAARMSTALKNLDAAQLEGMLGVSAKITRYFAAINTQYNPIFGTVNLARDVQGALLNLSSTPLKGKFGAVAANVLSALKGVYFDARAARDGKTPSSKWAALWDEFQAEGGQTGFRDMFSTSADRVKAIQRELDPEGWMNSPLGKVFTANGALKVPLSVAQKQATGLFGWLSDYNLAMENAVRLSAYKVALEQGMSKQQAASLGKNLTVNFNRKGQVGQQVGALYAFFNAAMQGTARLGSTLFTMEPGKPKTIRLSKSGEKIVYGGILLGVMQALLLSASGFDDEEPPEFVRERSLVIPTGGKGYITIPMPLGLHVLPNLGRIPTEFALGGFKDPAENIFKLLGLSIGAFNPIGGGASLVQMFSPTAIDPLVALAENKDWTGKPIAKTAYNKAIPGYALAKDTASAPAKVLAEAINAMTGGTEYTSGVFSPTPDQIDYLWGQVTGGVGRELSKTQQTISAGFSGEELPMHKIPLAGRFYGNADTQSAQSSRFYASINRLNRHEEEIKGLRKDGRGAEVAEYMTDNPDARLFMAGNMAERAIQKMRGIKRELIAEDAPTERVKEIERQITERMTRFNEMTRQAKAH